MVMLCIIVLLVPAPIQAKSEKSKMKALVNQLEIYEWELLARGMKKVKLSNREIAEAAALSIHVLKDHKKTEFGEYTQYKISDKEVKNAAKNMFGKKAGIKQLRKNPKEEDKRYFDAYRLKDGTAVVDYGEMETDTDYIVNSVSVKKNKKDVFTLTKKVYFGYWGVQTKKSNYKITYKLKNTKKSKYGYIIKAITVSEIK